MFFLLPDLRSPRYRGLVKIVRRNGVPCSGLPVADLKQGRFRISFRHFKGIAPGRGGVLDDVASCYEASWAVRLRQRFVSIAIPAAKRFAIHDFISDPLPRARITYRPKARVGYPASQLLQTRMQPFCVKSPIS